MERLTPARNENNVPIVFSANNFFIPYTAVMIQSILEHASPEKHYDIILLHSEEPGDYRERLQRLASRYKNCTLRLYDVSEHCRGISFYTKGGNGLLTSETYYRLLIGDILSEEYEKVIYLDGDMVACTNVAPLLDIDLDGYYLAAVTDVGGIGLCHSPYDTTLKNYWKRELNLKNTESYFNGGLLAINLQELFRDYPCKKLLEIAVQRNWMLHDQDVLNLVCAKGKAKLLDFAWNVQPDYGSYQFLPPSIFRQQQKAEAAPRIVHYAGSQKPWNGPCVREHFFWQTAAKTEFFELIVRRAVTQAQKGQANCKLCSPEQIETVRKNILNEDILPSYAEILDFLNIEIINQTDAVEHEALGLAGRLELALRRYPPCIARPLMMIVRKLYQIKHERKF